MANMTPPMNTTGRFATKSPWELPANLVYQCIAIRSFEDIYKQGIDVQEVYYTPMGLVSGAAFNFAEEQSKKPNIITLHGSDGSIVYIPDTYILSYPKSGEIRYQHVVLCASIGALPEFVDLTALKNSLENLISAQLGTVVEVHEVVAPSTDQPTNAQHEILEAARAGSITAFENDHTKLKKEEAKSALLDAKVKTLVAILKANGLLPT